MVKVNSLSLRPNGSYAAPSQGPGVRLLTLLMECLACQERSMAVRPCKFNAEQLQAVRTVAGTLWTFTVNADQ